MTNNTKKFLEECGFKVLSVKMEFFNYHFNVSTDSRGVLSKHLIGNWYLNKDGTATLTMNQKDLL